MSKKTFQFLLGVGSVIELLPPDDFSGDDEINRLISSRPTSAAAALRSDFLRVEHDFRRAFNVVISETDAKKTR
jgi:hypothetical protein